MQRQTGSIFTSLTSHYQFATASSDDEIMPPPDGSFQRLPIAVSSDQERSESALSDDRFNFPIPLSAWQNPFHHFEQTSQSLPYPSSSTSSHDSAWESSVHTALERSASDVSKKEDSSMLASLRNEDTNLSRELQKVINEKKSADVKLNAAQRLIEDLNAKIINSYQREENLKRKFKEEFDSHETTIEKLNTKQNELNDLTKRCKYLNNNIGELNQSISILENTIKKEKDSHAKTIGKLEETKDQLSKRSRAKRELREKQAELDELRRNFKILTEQKKKIAAKLTAVREQNALLPEPDSTPIRSSKRKRLKKSDDGEQRPSMQAESSTEMQSAPAKMLPQFEQKEPCDGFQLPVGEAMSSPLTSSSSFFSSSGSTTTAQTTTQLLKNTMAINTLYLQGLFELALLTQAQASQNTFPLLPFSSLATQSALNFSPLSSNSSPVINPMTDTPTAERPSTATDVRFFSLPSATTNSVKSDHGRHLPLDRQSPS